MRNFVSLIENEKFKVGCTGQTTYVYDKNGTELAKFRKDILYGYFPIFCPTKNMFIVKSTEGRLAIYSLDEMKLIKKFRYSPCDASQDDGACFSPDGKLFYNIERYPDTLHTRLSVYETEQFNRINTFFEDSSDLFFISHIEYDELKQTYFIFGQTRGDLHHFISKFDSKKLSNTIYLTKEQGEYLHWQKRGQMYGFTKSFDSMLSFMYDKKTLEDMKLKKIVLSWYYDNMI